METHGSRPITKYGFMDGRLSLKGPEKDRVRGLARKSVMRKVLG